MTLPTITDTHVSGEAGTNSVNVTEYQERIKQKKARVKNAERILIIEDDEETRLYLEEMLSPSYKIMSARDGNSGLQRALTELPDLVLTDIVMPGTNGLQILKRIKNNSNTTHIPVILLTSNTSMDDRLEGLENGADGYIVKPFNIEELFTTIDNILKNRQRIRGKFSGAHQEHNIKPIEVKGNSDKLMEKIMVVINDNLDNPDLRVEMLSEEVGLSRAQLHRRMKEITGISTGEFIRNIRLKKAAELLAEKKVNISQVAYMVGFSDSIQEILRNLPYRVHQQRFIRTIKREEAAITVCLFNYTNLSNQKHWVATLLYRETLFQADNSAGSRRNRRLSFQTLYLDRAAELQVHTPKFPQGD